MTIIILLMIWGYCLLLLCIYYYWCCVLIWRRLTQYYDMLTYHIRVYYSIVIILCVFIVLLWYYCDMTIVYSNIKPLIIWYLFSIDRRHQFNVIIGPANIRRVGGVTWRDVCPAALSAYSRLANTVFGGNGYVAPIIIIYYDQWPAKWQYQLTWRDQPMTIQCGQ